MMRLLKYDWKRNANSILGLMTILLIIEILLMSIGLMRGWELSLVMALSMVSYGIVNTIMLVIVCRTFDQNIKLYNRRLLPIRPIWTITSSLIQAWISILVLMSLVFLHLWIFWGMEGAEHLIVDIPSFITFDFVLVALAGAWKFTLVILLIFFSITVARAIGKQVGLWIGILIFFVIQNGVAWMEFKLFSSDSGWAGQAFTISFERGSTAAVNNNFIEIPLGSLVFEMLLAAAFVYAMVYLINRKVEA